MRLVLVMRGIAMALMIRMIAITMRSSIRENPRFRRRRSMLGSPAFILESCQAISTYQTHLDAVAFNRTRPAVR